MFGPRRHEVVAACGLLAFIFSTNEAFSTNNLNFFAASPSTYKCSKSLHIKGDTIETSWVDLLTASGDTDAPITEILQKENSRNEDKSNGKSRSIKNKKANGTQVNKSSIKATAGKKRKVSQPRTQNKNGKSEKGNVKRKGVATKEKRIPLKELELGKEIDGTVVQLTEYGAFVQTKYETKQKGWVLLHVSQIQNEKVTNVGDVLKLGQKVRPRVIQIDYDSKEVGVSLRERRTPRKSLSGLRVGDQLEGVVKSIATYGAFIDVGYTCDALLHISRISLNKVENITDFVQLGDTLVVRVSKVDKKNKVMGVSLLPSTADEYLDRRMSNTKQKNGVKKIPSEDMKGPTNLLEIALES